MEQREIIEEIKNQISIVEKANERIDILMENLFKKPKVIVENCSIDNNIINNDDNEALLVENNNSEKRSLCEIEEHDKDDTPVSIKKRKYTKRLIINENDEKMQSFWGFISACCITLGDNSLDSSYVVKSSEFYEEYKIWTKKQELKYLSKQYVAKLLKEKFQFKKTKTCNKYLGLKLASK